MLDCGTVEITEFGTDDGTLVYSTTAIDGYDGMVIT
jgi:hypothetical protein